MKDHSTIFARVLNIDACGQALSMYYVTQTRDHYSTHQGNYFVRYLGGSRSDPKT